MNIISTTNARKNLSSLVDHVAQNNDVIFVGRRDKPEVVIMKAPKAYNRELSDITNTAASSGSFDWLADEPDLYSLDDAIQTYD